MTDLPDSPAGADASALPSPVPQPGDAAPDVTLRDVTGAAVRLSDYWARTPRGLVLVFLRHFG